MKLLVWKAVNKKTKGQSLAEYGLILGLVSIAAIAALTFMGAELTNIMNRINNTLSAAQANMIVR
jgi:pilus assembly protein Flp/PilA